MNKRKGQATVLCIFITVVSNMKACTTDTEVKVM